MTNNHPHPNPKAVEAWMVSLGFELYKGRYDAVYYVHYGKDMRVFCETAAFFYTIHHTALTSFRDEVVEQVIGENQVWNVEDRDYGFKDQGKNELRAEQRKAIQTISERHGL